MSGPKAEEDCVAEASSEPESVNVAEPHNGGGNGSLSDWLGLIRFSHTLFALPFAILAMVMAYATALPDGSTATVRLVEIVGVLLCMVTARNAAMAFNRLVDRHLDAENPRTAQRHIPAGKLKASAVGLFTACNAAAFIASTLLFLPNWVPLIGAVPVLGILLGYSLAKRFTSSAHLWLGISLSLSPVCAWLAVRGPISLQNPSDLMTPVLLAFAVAAWVNGFDIIYACQDAEFDRQAKLHSVPARFGVAGALKIAAASHGMMLLFLAIIPWSTPNE